jgi:hypothetical protein
VVPHDLLPDGTLPTSVATDAKLIVLSHDCDLVNKSYEAEPFIEFFVARPRATEDRDGLLFNGKNPRKLQFLAQENGQSRLYEIDVHEKYRADRRILEKGRPDASITIHERDVVTIAKWASRRYNRPSMPTAFMNRIGNPVKTKLMRKLKRDGEDVVCVLLAFNTIEELPVDKPYRLILWVVVDPEVCEDDAREQRAIGVVSDLRKLLAQCLGIEVEDADVKKTSDITLLDLKHLIRWDVDYLSPDTEPVED